MQVIWKAETLFRNDNSAHRKLAISKVCIITSANELDSEEHDKIRSVVSYHEANDSIFEESQNDSF